MRAPSGSPRRVHAAFPLAAVLGAILVAVLSTPLRAGAESASVTAGLYVNMVPDLTYLTPLASITRGRLYAEGRYQYEDLETGSVWFGRTFEGVVGGEGGDEFTWWVAPLAGGVFGRTRGFAPGLNADLGWREFSFSTSAEYLFNIEDGDESFFYSWSEWLYTPRPPFAAGLTVERSRLRALAGDVNVALTLYAGYRNATVSFYAFNVWDSDDDYYMLGLGGEF